MKVIFELFKDSYVKWREDRASRLAAALSYYTVFSLAPLLIVVMVIVGSVYGQEAAQGQIVGQIEDIVGARVARSVQTIIENADRPEAGVAAIFSLGAIVFGATNMFIQLQEAINQVWGTEEENDDGIKVALRQRLAAIVMILIIGVLLMLSFLTDTLLTIVGTLLQDLLPDVFPVLQVVNLAFSFAIVTLLFALIYKYLPKVRIAWRDVLPGAVLAAALHILARYILNFYLSQSGTVSAYGAAGSVIVLLLWIYFSVQIMLYGAEFGQVYAHRFGSRSGPRRTEKSQQVSGQSEKGNLTTHTSN